MEVSFNDEEMSLLVDKVANDVVDMYPNVDIQDLHACYYYYCNKPTGISRINNFKRKFGYTGEKFSRFCDMYSLYMNSVKKHMKEIFNADFESI